MKNPYRFARPVARAALCTTLVAFLAGCGGGGSDASASKEGSRGGQRVDSSEGVDPDMARAGVTKLDLQGPHDPPVDLFHPDKDTVQPALGGRIIAHISSEPPSLNFALDNSFVVRQIHFDIHEGLLEFDPASWTYEPQLARRYDVEDTIILQGGRADDNSNIVFGKVREEGDAYVVTSGSSHNDIEERRVPKSEVLSVEYGTVCTFDLRDDVVWHDGEPFDAEDVIFSYDIYSNPHVDCDEKRFAFEDIVHGEMLDPHTVRFFFREQYFAAIQTFDLAFCILPSHLYNLKDPSNPDHDPNASAAREGEYINQNPHNIDWVGLGPYKLDAWERGQYLEASRFDRHFRSDPAETGYADVLRWRYISDDNLAFQALLNGEIDIFDRVKSEDFLGAATQQEAFTNNFYKAFTYLGNVGFTVWNVYRPQLSDVRVRTALAHAFDVKDWIRTNYQGLALPATFAMFRFGGAYNRDVDVYPYDLEKAQDLLADAGWIDRDGNGIVDKDGKDLTIQLMMPSGNKASETLLQKMQESFEKIGVKCSIQPFEWATFIERIRERDFDSANLAWALSDVEGDPTDPGTAKRPPSTGARATCRASPTPSRTS